MQKNGGSMSSRSKAKSFTILVVFLAPFNVQSHDTTHIHPLITLNIAKLIRTVDEGIGKDNAYNELYKLLSVPINTEIIPEIDQFLYWGTDFDPVGIATTPLPIQEYLGGDRLAPYLNGDDPISKNVITGAVFEDNPGLKVRHHFYHGTSGEAIDVPIYSDELPSSNRAMLFFNQAIETMAGYTEEAKQESFFLFGQALHHVEDMIAPAHIHNDAENSLSASILRYGQLKNTHVANSTLRFLNSSRLALK